MKEPSTGRVSAVILKGMLYLFALIAAITGPLAFFKGTGVVPQAGAVTPSLDNELRFFSVYWFAYGVLCFFVARHLEARKNWVPMLALVMFASGCARTASIILVGRPLDQFFYGAGVELVFPIVMYLCYRRLAEASTPEALRRT
jgi:Domain of unknown function (DUF4345)